MRQKSSGAINSLNIELKPTSQRFPPSTPSGSGANFEIICFQANDNETNHMQEKSYIFLQIIFKWIKIFIHLYSDPNCILAVGASGCLMKRFLHCFIKPHSDKCRKFLSCVCVRCVQVENLYIIRNAKCNSMCHVFAFYINWKGKKYFERHYSPLPPQIWCS